MKKVNLYLVAFFAVLVHALVLGMTIPEMAVLLGLLVKISFDSYLDSKTNKENIEPLKLEIKRINEHIVRVDNLAKSLNIRR